jgi:MFS family permease
LRWRSVASNRQRAAYAVGFLDRLIGVVDGFGYLGDKYGRKPVLIATLLLMGLSTAVIDLLPTRRSPRSCAVTASRPRRSAMRRHGSTGC